MWNDQQRHRLAFELKITAREASRFRFHDPRGETYIQGPALPLSHQTPCQLRLQLSPEFPWESPRLFVIEPTVLPMHAGGTLAELGVSHDYHVLGPEGPGGCIELCFIDTWQPDMTVLGVLIKGEIWTKAYYEHLREGRTIDEILHQWNHELERSQL